MVGKGTLLQDKLQRFQQRGQFQDLKVVVTCLDGTQADFRCHRVILAALSSTLENKLRDLGVGDTLNIRIKTKDPWIFRNVIRSAYGFKPSFYTVPEAMGAHILAKQLGCLPLARTSGNFVLARVRPNTIWPLLDMALDKSPIQRKALKVLTEETTLCLWDSGFLGCSRRALELLVAAPELQVREVDLVERVVSWANEMNGGQRLTPEVAKDVLGAVVIGGLRLLTLTADEFGASVAKAGLLDSEALLAVLVNIHSPGQLPMPDGLSQSKEHRAEVKKEEEA
ncbi:uncharacterized protein LOC135947116 [Cloeon dipterum]|uniref:uncharacterized protein LOC135947116 n=1 Tax=Cloeon dipterum TaxID=197152 RepID=UPI00321FCC4B